MLTRLFCYDVEYKNIFSLKKDKHKGGIILWLQCILICFSFTAHVCAKCKHADSPSVTRLDMTIIKIYIQYLYHGRLHCGTLKNPHTIRKE